MNKHCILCISVFFISTAFCMEQKPEEVVVEPFSPRRFTRLLQEQDPKAVLISAIHEKNIEKVRYCLDREIKEASDEHKRKECKAEDPYGVALVVGKPEIIHEFIKHGYSVDQLISYETYTQSPRTKSPPEASKDGKHNRKKTKKLLQHYKNIKRAVKGDSKNELKSLLKKHYVDARFKDYRTALHVACLLHKCDCAQILIEHGANVNARDAHNYSPLYLAVHDRAKQYDRLLQLLKVHSADISYAQKLAEKDKDDEALETLKKLSQQSVSFDPQIKHID